MEPKIIALSDSWIAVNKPSGWLSIPSSRGIKEDDPNLLSWLRAQGHQPWVIHRLDQCTSGVIIFAGNKLCHALANEWLRLRKVKKTYHCLASGAPRLPLFKIDIPVNGCPSTTQLVVKKRLPGGFFAEVFPRTGRRHQIRKHFAHQGWPLWGDTLYGGPETILESGMGVSRVALHASKIEFPSGEVFQAPLAEDIVGWLNKSMGQGVSDG